MDGVRDGLTSVVVVAADSGPLLLQCVDRVLASSAPVEIIVVDNASRDGFAATCAAAHAGDARLRLIANADNRGFGPACNQGAAAASGDALVFLNPDCLVDADTIAALRAIADGDRSIGLLGVDVPQGKTSLTLRFLPREAWGGLAITFASLTALGYFCRKKARHAPPAPREIALAFAAPLVPFLAVVSLVHEAKPPPLEMKTPSGEEMVLDSLPPEAQKLGVRFDGGVTLEGFSMSTTRPAAE